MTLNCTGFAPIFAPTPRCLILGTMPSIKSLEIDFYYGHPRNGFWPIMQACFGLPIETLADKRQLIESSGLFLWDVLAQCEREGSLDMAIKHPLANDFASIFTRHVMLKTVIFNGQVAAQLFKRHVIAQQVIPADLTFHTLPSTSPANARVTLEDKWLKWQAVLSKIE